MLMYVLVITRRVNRVIQIIRLIEWIGRMEKTATPFASSCLCNKLNLSPLNMKHMLLYHSIIGIDGRCAMLVREVFHKDY